MPWEFQCDNQLCITLDYVCDSDDDCRDNSDELNCQDLCDNKTQVQQKLMQLPYNFITNLVWTLESENGCVWASKCETKRRKPNAALISIIISQPNSMR